MRIFKIVWESLTDLGCSKNPDCHVGVTTFYIREIIMVKSSNNFGLDDYFRSLPAELLWSVIQACEKSYKADLSFYQFYHPGNIRCWKLVVVTSKCCNDRIFILECWFTVINVLADIAVAFKKLSRSSN